MRRGEVVLLFECEKCGEQTELDFRTWDEYIKHKDKLHCWVCEGGMLLATTRWHGGSR